MDKTFCIYPWMQLASRTNGTARLCCTSDSAPCIEVDSGKQFVFGEDSIEELWNSKYYKQLRKDMIKGRPRPECKVCYLDEKMGKISKRQGAYSKFFDTDQENSILRNYFVHHTDVDGYLSLSPIAIDLKLGNLCNLKCRMCDGNSSSQIAKEEQHLTTYPDGYSAKKPSRTLTWADNPKFFDEFKQYLPDMIHIYATGGEPTLNKNLETLLLFCIENRFAENITLHMVTNLTNMNMLEFYAKHFKKVILTVSFDGEGQTYEYIRTPANWRKFIDNFIQILEIPNITVGALFTLSSYNIHNMIPCLTLIKHLLDQHDTGTGTFNINHVYNPVFLSPIHLPDEYKQQISREIRTALSDKIFEGKNAARVKNALESLPEYLNQSWDKQQFDKFVKYTQMLDFHRKQSFDDINPDLFEAYIKGR